MEFDTSDLPFLGFAFWHSYLYIMANRLIKEQSPYLLQHAHNPVDWYPWGDEAFEMARAHNKPVLVSIGYAACHWCHVMERESFEDPQVAAMMNEYFVCIKVDREEHPDVDHMYMDAVQAISGSGGWPLNVFVTHDRAPFYGGTYYPPRPAYSRPSWPQLLQRMNEVWHEQQDEVTLQAGQMLEHLRQASMRVSVSAEANLTMDTCRQIAENLLAQADTEKGGFGNAPKFPGTMAISYLLEHFNYTGYEPALAQALLSLDSMIEGGIYDQLGGGFARYATDRDWLIPHFEKMLYDNALLILPLCDAYTLTQKERYKEVVEETIAFVNRELRDPSGGFYCALDADSEGVEGKYYTWDHEDWLAVVRDADNMVAMYYDVTEKGNWEGTNILHVSRSIEDVAEETATPLPEVLVVLERVRKDLLNAREQRIRPMTDDKCLLGWNALMNTALCKAGTTLGNNSYLEQASAHMRWMQETYFVNGTWLHTWKQGVARIPAKLDDLAYLAQAMLQLASATGDNELISNASAIVETVLADFSSGDGYFYFTPAAQHDIPVRKVDLYDGAQPSANSVMAYNLLLCGMCMERTEWIEQAERMIHGISGTASRYAYSFANWGLQVQRQVVGQHTIVCVGQNGSEAAAEIRGNYVPAAFLLTCEKEISIPPILAKKYFDGNLSIFVCSKAACLPPVSSVSAALTLIRR